MTEVRDIPESFEFLKNFWSDIENVRNAEVELVQSDILSYLRWCEAEKERADKASDTAAEWICKHKAEETRFQRQNRELAETKEREKKLREYIERIIKAEDILFHEPVRWRDTGSKLLATLYPLDKEEEAK